MSVEKGTSYLVCAAAYMRFIRAFRKALKDVEMSLTPTVPIPAPEIGQRKVDIDGYEETVRSAFALQDRLT